MVGDEKGFWGCLVLFREKVVVFLFLGDSRVVGRKWGWGFV